MKRHFNWNLKAGLILIGISLALTLAGIFYTPYDPGMMNPAVRFSAPGLSHLLGTDNFGRDLLSRIMTGTRFTFLVAVGTIAISTALGTFFGLLAGYYGGAADEAIMRLSDALTAFPGILLALVLIAVLGQGNEIVVLALGVIFTPSFARIVRSETLRLKEQEFVQSAVVRGASPIRIMMIHILPNLSSTLFSAVTVGFSNAILAESGMSYLGFGIQPPDPSLGRMLFEAQSYLFSAPWYAIFPGLMIILLSVGFSLTGDGLRSGL